MDQFIYWTGYNKYTGLWVRVSRSQTDARKPDGSNILHISKPTGREIDTNPCRNRTKIHRISGFGYPLPSLFSAHPLLGKPLSRYKDGKSANEEQNDKNQRTTEEMGKNQRRKTRDRFKILLHESANIPLGHGTQAGYGPWARSDNNGFVTLVFTRSW